MSLQDTLAHVEAAERGALQRARDYVALTKPRLNAMAVFAVAAGWWAEAGISGGAGRFVGTLLGAGLVACGASALNQCAERERDALMERTRDRPLPAGRLGLSEAVRFGSLLCGLGVAALALWATPLAAALGGLTLATYVGIYTPLKTRTSLNTLVGTIPGALPPLIGAAAASGALSERAWFLFALIAVWQLPHFLSIAWLYRDDYERAGFVMLPGATNGSGATGRQVVLQGLLTVLVSLAALPLGLAGRTYFLLALLAGSMLVGAGIYFAARRTDASARLLLRASLVHLPIVLAAFALSSG